MSKPQLFCSLDLELEQPNTNPQTPDSQLSESRIIQMGYVIFEVIEGGIKIHRERSIFIDIGVPLSTYIKKLTGITDEQIRGGMALLEAYNVLLRDLEELPFKRSIVQWGGGDIEFIRQELDIYFPGTKWEFGQSGMNVKHMYQTWALANNAKWRGGLKKCLNVSGLMWDKSRGSSHDALADAVNTARMYGFIQGKLRE